MNIDELARIVQDEFAQSKKHTNDRFAGVDKRFDHVDKRFAELHDEMDERFSRVDAQFI